jgi:DNA polymerase (family X)
MENIEFAKILAETADLMEIAAEDSFRIRSYRNAASVVESWPERIASLLADPSKDLTKIPGIGKGIAAVLAELEREGTFDRRETLLEKYPPTALEMLKIQGLGPKTIALLVENFRISTLDDLQKLCEEQKVRTLPRLGAKHEEKILRGIEQYRKLAGRFLLNFAAKTAAELTEYIHQLEGITQITPAGSFRRAKETVGDLDLLVTGPNAQSALDHFVKHPKVQDVFGHGENKASARFGIEGIQVDVRALPEAHYGAALQYFTGSKEHNIVLRQRALKLGFTLNEYGLSRLDNGEIAAARTEAEIYEKLGLAFIPPELRENAGEIEAAEKNALPALLELADIRGDIHMHTRASDGRATLEEMAETARARGYEYIAITDHSKALAMANGLDETRTLAFAERVAALDHSALGIRVFSGIECDILRDGKMDLHNDALAALDLVIGSVHSYMNMDSSEMTERYLACLENPHVKILGHPTGRVLLHRDAYVYNFEKVAAAAAKRGVAMEINASPERLDLHASLIRIAKNQGCKFTISTDAHHPRHMENMQFGVRMARRGWLTKADILNTLPLGQFQNAFQNHS